MSKRLHLEGRVFGRLTAVCDVGTSKSRRALWLCKCECGKEIIVCTRGLMHGDTKSCGCLQLEIFLKNRIVPFKHGHAKGKLSPTYLSWKSMIQRCINPSGTGYKHYGGIGVLVCERWLNSFAKFLEDMGVRPEGTTLSRFGDTGNYEPSNCSWHTFSQQTIERMKKKSKKEKL